MVKAAIAWITNSGNIVVLGSVVYNTRVVTSENEKQIIINTKEEKNKYTSIFSSSAKAFSIIFWWGVGNKNQNDFSIYTS